MPIGVFVQRPDTTGSRVYENLGLTYVDCYDGTHFVLRGEPIDYGQAPAAGATAPAFQPFDTPSKPVAERLIQLREPRFSWAVWHAYHEKFSLCSLGYRLRGQSLALEAAHVIPFKDQGTSRDVRNGVLLCRNHHALYDGYAWAFDEDYRVIVAADKEFRV